MLMMKRNAADAHDAGWLAGKARGGVRDKRNAADAHDAGL